MLAERVSLKELTTLRVGGPAAFLAECKNEEEVAAAILLSQNRGLPLAVLAEGSNTLASDAGFAGVVLKPAIPGIAFEEQEDETTLAVAGAGVSWDALVRAAAARNLWGLENLAGIPGSVGAAPVQNIGAYGAELSHVFVWCDALPRAGGSMHRFELSDAAFGYRDSVFKKGGAWIITRVALRLAHGGKADLAYKDLAALAQTGVSLRTPEEVGDAVRSIRGAKFPDLATYGTAGSFFKNPTITAAAYTALLERYPGLPGFSTIGGMKVPLAWILDTVLSLRGFCKGNVRLYENQPLVLVTEPGATAREVGVFADEIAAKVYTATGIVIEREVQNLF